MPERRIGPGFHRRRFYSTAAFMTTGSRPASSRICIQLLGKGSGAGRARFTLLHLCKDDTSPETRGTWPFAAPELRAPPSQCGGEGGRSPSQVRKNQPMPCSFDCCCFDDAPPGVPSRRMSGGERVVMPPRLPSVPPRSTRGRARSDTRSPRGKSGARAHSNRDVSGSESH